MNCTRTLGSRRLGALPPSCGQLPPRFDKDLHCALGRQENLAQGHPGELVFAFDAEAAKNNVPEDELPRGADGTHVDMGGLHSTAPAELTPPPPAGAPMSEDKIVLADLPKSIAPYFEEPLCSEKFQMTGFRGEVLKRCKAVLKEIFDEEDAAVFKAPVDAAAFGFTDYHQVRALRG
jgi:hypothetical protein